MSGKRRSSRFKNRLLAKKAMDIKEMRLCGVDVKPGKGGTDVVAKFFRGQQLVAGICVNVLDRNGQLGYSIYGSERAALFDFDEAWRMARQLAMAWKGACSVGLGKRKA